MAEKNAASALCYQYLKMLFERNGYDGILFKYIEKLMMIVIYMTTTRALDNIFFTI